MFTSIIFNLIGLGLIALIIWWFWMSKGSKPKAVKSNDVVDITVDGGVYIPATIEAKRDQQITLRFTREDPSPCAEAVVFSSLGLSQDLPVGKPTEVKLNLDTPGEFEFTCPMGMYRGSVIVK